jgi:hypothetical protein
MRPAAAESEWDQRGLVLLLAGVFAGPAAWGFHLMIAYSLVKPACAAGAPYILTIVTAAAVLVTAAGLAASWRCWDRLRHAGAPEGGTTIDRSYFLAVAGLVLNTFFLLLLAVSLVPQVVLSPCE